MGVCRLLVTGATGFVGSWVLRHWHNTHPDVEVWATSNQPGNIAELSDKFSIIDLRDSKAVREFIHECKPTHVIHLAGLVTDAPLTEHLAINVLGTENLYDALSEMDGSKDLRIIQASTAAIYGQVEPKELPISEKNPFRPLTAYAISKMAQDYLADKVWRTKGLGVIRARIFNLLGPGQPRHLVPVTFISQLKEINEGDSLKVGNLATRRDFIDVRDVILAFDRLLTDGRPGEAYNIASGKSIAIWDIVNELINMSGLSDISIKPEYTRIRKNDVPDIFADITAIAEAINWQPQISLQESLEAMWNDL